MELSKSTPKSATFIKRNKSHQSQESKESLVSNEKVINNIS